MYNQNASEEAIGATLTLTIQSIYLYTYIPTTRGVRDRIYIEQTSTYIVLFFWTRGIIRDIMNLQNLSSSCLYFIGILLKLTTGKTRCFRLFMFDVFPLCTEALRVRLSPMYADCRVHEGESEMSTLFIPLFYFPLISPKRDRDHFVPLKRFYVVFAFFSPFKIHM